PSRPRSRCCNPSSACHRRPSPSMIDAASPDLGRGGPARARPRRRMKRALIPAAAVVAGVLVFAVMSATAGSSRTSSGSTVHVIEHAITDAVTNGPKADKAGNVLTFGNPVYDSADAKKVGKDSGFCVRILAHRWWECLWTTFLLGGQLTVE